MKKVYIISAESPFEFQAAFDEDFKCLDAWSMNDANWRNEYFSGMMQKLGIVTLECFQGLIKPKKQQELMNKAAMDIFGIESDD